MRVIKRKPFRTALRWFAVKTVLIKSLFRQLDMLLTTRCPAAGAEGVGGAMSLLYICTRKKQSDFFRYYRFQTVLFEQTEMSHGTVREYVVRLRRLGNTNTSASKTFPNDLP